MQIQDITLREHCVAIAPQADDRIEGAQVVAELPLGVAQLAGGSRGRRRRGLARDPRIAQVELRSLHQTAESIAVVRPIAGLYYG